MARSTSKAEHNYNPEQVRRRFLLHAGAVPTVQKPAVREEFARHATWQGDGITVIDYDWCIGCRLRKPPALVGAAIQLDQAGNSKGATQPENVLSRRRCADGARDGEMPLLHPAHAPGKISACLEVCPAGARKFGNVLDPNSEVAYILRKRVFIN
ncbi:MAG: hypothetical protein U1F83_17110 [Verrucomicrobiota bacterium]